MDETEQIMRFIKNKKADNFDLKTRLRKVSNIPAIPRPPPLE
jgi:hypothetical protein